MPPMRHFAAVFCLPLAAGCAMATDGAGPGAIGIVDDRREALLQAGIRPVEQDRRPALLAAMAADLSRRLPPGLAAPRVSDTAVVVVMDADTVYLPDGAELGGRGWRIVGGLAGTLGEHPATVVDILGHAGAAPRRLAEARVQALARGLRRAGISPTRIAAFDLGTEFGGRARIEVVLQPLRG